MLDSELTAYSEYCTILRGRSRATVSAYIWNVRKFSEFLNARGDEIFSATRADVEDWLKSLFFDRHNSNSSRAVKLAAVRDFYAWLVRERYLSASPCQDIPSPKFAQHSARKFSTEELRQIFAAPDLSTEIGIRDLAVLMVLYGAGPRVSEIASLTLRQMQFTAETCTLTFFGKGAKERTVKLERVPTAAIRNWWQIRVAASKMDEPLFTSLTRDRGRRGYGITKESINAILKKYAVRFGIPDADAFVHKMRSTFASDLYDQIKDPLVVAAKMGHEDVKTTMRYIENSQTALNSGKISNARWRELTKQEG